MATPSYLSSGTAVTGIACGTPSWPASVGPVSCVRTAPSHLRGPSLFVRGVQALYAGGAGRQCSGLIWRKILTAHNFGAFGSGNSDNRTFFRISGQILGENPLENPDSVRILPKTILSGSRNGRQNHDNPEDRDTAGRWGAEGSMGASTVTAAPPVPHSRYQKLGAGTGTRARGRYQKLGESCRCAEATTGRLNRQPSPVAGSLHTLPRAWCSMLQAKIHRTHNGTPHPAVYCI